ncbi:hypothetical protein GYMLUDRAFT_417568 [Collybiopsis luxurians FD-317 M1]|uniref:Uncharacterized protein n=1 Tax=Collybiopsis luxurians FD-317 M1 TaxID=944289 RepID=A0A0D0BZW7_9AGAR|nr:hypothetical protein GYMLUDRAFT_417568 [Collybiopsis luxurians FD-317 M1]
MYIKAPFKYLPPAKNTALTFLSYTLETIFVLGQYLFLREFCYITTLFHCAWCYVTHIITPVNITTSVHSIH